jgi:hypothetical protein
MRPDRPYTTARAGVKISTEATWTPETRGSRASLGELEHELVFANHPELVARDALDRGGIGAEVIDVVSEVTNLAAKAHIGGLDVPELRLQRPVARKPLVVEHPHRHGDDREYEKGERQEPSGARRGTSHGRMVDTVERARQFSGARRQRPPRT